MAECVAENKPRPKPKPRSVAKKELTTDSESSRNGISVSDGVTSKERYSPSGGDVIVGLISQNKQLDESLSKYDTEILDRKRIMEELQKELDELQDTAKSLDGEIHALKADNNVTDDILQEVEKYLLTYERLKADEKLFKASCNEELERLQKELEMLDTDMTDATKNDLMAQLERNRARLEAGKMELATINRQVASIQRQIEQVPNRMELKEYRLRFSELYNQVSATHRSTKQFFSLYNSLEDTKRYLEKELSLLNSIVDSYQAVCATASGREEFLRQLQSINEGMKETGAKVEKRYQSDRFSVETLQAEIQRLLDVKVAYEKCLLELETECRRNDHLLGECKAIEGEAKPVIHTQGSSSGESDNE